MNALIWTQNHRLELCEQEEPQLASPTDVKIKVHLTGICGTDLAVVAGKEEGVAGVIRGHEAVGTVIAIGEQVEGIRLNDRVVIDPNQSCEQCYFCKRDQPHLCMGEDGLGMLISGLNAPGTFAPYYVTDQRLVRRIPESMSWEAAVLVEPLACVLHNFHEANVGRGDSVLVLGSGPMGLLCQYVSMLRSRITVATEVNPYRLYAAARISDFAIIPEQLNESFISRILGNRKFDVIIDTVGNQLDTAEKWIERGGRIVPFGINASYRYTFSPTKFIQNGIKIIGAGEYRHMFDEALLLAGKLPNLEGVVTKKYELKDHERAINELLSHGESPGETLKTVFVP